MIAPAGVSVCRATNPSRIRKNVFAGSPSRHQRSAVGEVSFLAETGDRIQLLGCSNCGTSVRRQHLLDALHRRTPYVGSAAGAGFARIAETSSVMSIPTGHQVMQRPQPTQPEVPNWSIQVASLWVIHCR